MPSFGLGALGKAIGRGAEILFGTAPSEAALTPRELREVVRLLGDTRNSETTLLRAARDLAEAIPQLPPRDNIFWFGTHYDSFWEIMADTLIKLIGRYDWEFDTDHRENGFFDREQHAHLRARAAAVLMMIGDHVSEDTFQDALTAISKAPPATRWGISYLADTDPALRPFALFALWSATHADVRRAQRKDKWGFAAVEHSTRSAHKRLLDAASEAAKASPRPLLMAGTPGQASRALPSSELSLDNGRPISPIPPPWAAAAAPLAVARDDGEMEVVHEQAKAQHLPTVMLKMLASELVQLLGKESNPETQSAMAESLVEILHQLPGDMAPDRRFWRTVHDETALAIALFSAASKVDREIGVLKAIPIVVRPLRLIQMLANDRLEKQGVETEDLKAEEAARAARQREMVTQMAW